MDRINPVTASAIATAAELTVANLSNPTELNSIGTAVPDWRVCRTVSAGTDDATWYRLDASTDSQSAPYIMDSATAGLKWVAIAGRYSNQSNTLGTTASLSLAKTTGTTLTVSSTDDTAAVDVAGTVRANRYRFASSILFAEESGNYTAIYTPAADIALSLGNATDPRNLYDNTSHVFRSISGSTTYLTLSSSAATFATGLGVTISKTTGTTLTVSSTDTSAISTSGGITASKGITCTGANAFVLGGSFQTSSTATASSSFPIVLFTNTDTTDSNGCGFRFLGAGTDATLVSGANILCQFTNKGVSVLDGILFFNTALGGTDTTRMRLQKTGLTLTTDCDGLFIDKTTGTTLTVSSTDAAAISCSGGANFTGNASNPVVVGIGSNARSQSTYFIANTAAGYNRALGFQTAGNYRWLLVCNNTAESGSNAGSDFAWNAYDDAGSFIDSPFAIARASGGIVTINRPLDLSTASSGLTISKTTGTTLTVSSTDSSITPTSNSIYTSGGVGVDGILSILNGGTFATPAVTSASLYIQANGTNNPAVICYDNVNLVEMAFGSFGGTTIFGTITNHQLNLRVNNTDLFTLATSGAATLTTSSSGLTIAKTTGTTLTVSSTNAAAISCSGGVSAASVVVTGGAFSGATIYKDGTNGLSIGSATGSSFDFYLLGPAGAGIMNVPTGTVNVGFVGSVQIATSQNLRMGTAAIATTATDGFIYASTCAGTPTGTPTTLTGTAPIVIDTTNHKLYFYSGGSWRDAGP